MTTKNISWNTTKTDAGYAYKVYEIVPRTTPNEIGHYADTVMMRTGVERSRAIAKNRAQAWCRYLKAEARKV